MNRSTVAALVIAAMLNASTSFAQNLDDIDGITLPPPASQSIVPDRINEGARLLSEGKSIEAEELLLEALTASGDSAEGFYNLGLALAFNGKHAEALDAQSKALILRDDFPEARLAQGIAYLTLGKPESALEAFEAVIARTPDSPTGRAALFDKGAALGRMKRYAEAELALSEALAADPDDPAPAFQIGRLKIEQQKWKDALGWLETAVAAYPLEANMLSARAHLRLGNRPEAGKALDLAAKSLATDGQNDATKAKLMAEIEAMRREAAASGTE
ncbi:MAG TPA: tetratricopeptide repeat protein [Candidatus Ozemobacteraceae bacterium]|nr:tetratricopeptide repeat protein [Candidatus Ozemobacteraceae bacterium]